jgi:hypothetical protein
MPARDRSQRCPVHRIEGLLAYEPHSGSSKGHAAQCLAAIRFISSRKNWVDASQGRAEQF